MTSLIARSDGDELTGLVMDRQRYAFAVGEDWVHEPALPLFIQLQSQLDAYFARDLTCFDLPLRLAGTEFQRQVWDELLRIPYGGTTTYGAIAEALGKPRASRAVGTANGRNPIAIVVPCHRVLGATGSLVGYGGGLAKKRALLDLECTPPRGHR